MPVLRRLTKEDIVKLSAPLSNLLLFLIPLRTRTNAVKKLLHRQSSKMYTYSDKLFTAITKLPKASASDPLYLPTVRLSPGFVDGLRRFINQFQTAWEKYRVEQTDALSTQIADILIGIISEFKLTYPTGYRVFESYRRDYAIDRENDFVGITPPIAPPKPTVVRPPPEEPLPLDSTVYPGIYTQKCVDPLMFTSQSLDTSSAILYILDETKVNRVYCLDADSLKGYLGDFTMMFYKCRPEVKPGAIMIRPENVFPTQIRRLPFDIVIYVYEEEIQKIRLGKKYVLLPTTIPVGRIASHDVITGGSVVSAEHCGNDYQHDVIYTVKELGDIPPPADEDLQRLIAAELAEEAAAKAVEKMEARATAAAKAKKETNATISTIPTVGGKFRNKTYKRRYRTKSHNKSRRNGSI